MKPFPNRLKLANLPTRIEKLHRFSQQLGIDVYVKRDDMTGTEWSGNKIRKLEFSVHEALDLGADTLITCGGLQSNHCRATAAVAARLDLHSCLLLRTEDNAPPLAVVCEGTIMNEALRRSGRDLNWVKKQAAARKLPVEEVYLMVACPDGSCDIIAKERDR